MPHAQPLRQRRTPELVWQVEISNQLLQKALLMECKSNLIVVAITIERSDKHSFESARGRLSFESRPGKIQQPLVKNSRRHFEQAGNASF